MSAELIIGFDPGKTGAYALYMPDARNTVEVEDLPVIGKHLNGVALISAMEKHKITFAVVEEVGVMPLQGGVSNFNFGRNFGAILGIVQALRLPYALTRPNQWKGVMRLSADKNLSRQRATELFPHQAERFKRVKDDGRAEAALLAVFAAEHLLRRAAA